MTITRYSGLSLVELLFCFSLFGVGLSVGLLFLPQVYKKNQVYMIIDDLKNAIHTAKIQAFMRGENLVLSPVDKDNNWSSGLFLFVDVNNDHAERFENILYEWHWSFEGVDVAWKGFQSTDYLLFANNIRYNTSNGYFIITWKDFCSVKLIVNRVGRVRQVGSC